METRIVDRHYTEPRAAADGVCVGHQTGLVAGCKSVALTGIGGSSPSRHTMEMIRKRVAPDDRASARSSTGLESPAHNGEVVSSNLTGRTV